MTDWKQIRTIRKNLVHYQDITELRIDFHTGHVRVEYVPLTEDYEDIGVYESSIDVSSIMVVTYNTRTNQYNYTPTGKYFEIRILGTIIDMYLIGSFRDVGGVRLVNGEYDIQTHKLTLIINDFVNLN